MYVEWYVSFSEFPAPKTFVATMTCLCGKNIKIEVPAHKTIAATMICQCGKDIKIEVPKIPQTKMDREYLSRKYNLDLRRKELEVIMISVN